MADSDGLPVRSITGAVVATTVGVLPLFLLGGLAVFVGEELRFGDAELGAAVGAYYLSSAVSSVPAGRLAERIGGDRAMLLGGAASTLALLIVAILARDWAGLLLAMLLGGLGNALAQLGANLALARTVPKHRQGLAFGLKQAAIPVATLLGGLAVPLVGLTVGWRWAFAVAPVLFLVLLSVAPRSGEHPVRRPGSLRAGDVSLAPLAVLALAAALGSASVNALGAFFVKSAVSSGLDVGSSGLVLAVASVTGIVGRVWSGHRADQREGGHLAQVALLMIVGGMAMGLLVFSEVHVLLVLGSVVAFGAGWGWNGLFTYAIVRRNPNAPAAATGITQLGLFAGGMVGPLVFGATAEASSFAAAWLGAAVALMVGAVLILVGRRMLLQDVAVREAAASGAASPETVAALDR
ncbi:MAG: MFS transporter [Chloroflexi bacterium]|nr:MFS transporter [Chloroflexota bacterium]